MCKRERERERGYERGDWLWVRGRVYCNREEWSVKCMNLLSFYLKWDGWEHILLTISLVLDLSLSFANSVSLSYSLSLPLYISKVSYFPLSFAPLVSLSYSLSTSLRLLTLKFHIYFSLSFPVSQLMFWLSPSHFAKSKTHFPPRWRFFASIRNTKGGK